jgi:regulator of sigma E protease
MTLIVTVISFLVVLSILVLVHELGHFAAGRWARARIDEFAIGFPPRIWSVRRGETDYSINAIPLGGYVKFAGEDNPDIPNGLSSIPRGKRAVVLVAGVVMNFLFAILLFSLIFATGYPHVTAIDGVKITGVVSGAPAESAGLKSGDVVLQIDGQPVNDTAAFSEAVKAKQGNTVTLLVQSANGDQRTSTLVPRANPPQGEGPMGISIEQNSVSTVERFSLLQSLRMGAQKTWDTVVLTVSVPVMVLRGMIPADVARPVGPIGISRYVGSATEVIPTLGLYPILSLMALLSVSLAVVNILPVPGLDGGRLLFVLLEAVRGGKRVSPEREAMFHFAGLMFFMGLVVVITFFDIVKPAPGISWGP